MWAIGLLVFAAIIAGQGAAAVRARGRRPVWTGSRRGSGTTLVYGFGQRKFLPGEQPSGIMHALIFWGFVVLLLQVVTAVRAGVRRRVEPPRFGADEPLGPPFFLARDLLEVVVIVGVLYMLYRRLIAHTPRLFGLGAPSSATARPRTGRAS